MVFPGGGLVILAGTRSSTIDLFRYPIEHGCNQTIGTKKKIQKPQD
jgi:hypothetical protein